MENWFKSTQKIGIVASGRIAFEGQNCFCKTEPNMWKIVFFNSRGSRIALD